MALAAGDGAILDADTMAIAIFVTAKLFTSGLLFTITIIVSEVASLAATTIWPFKFLVTVAEGATISNIVFDALARSHRVAVAVGVLLFHCD